MPEPLRTSSFEGRLRELVERVHVIEHRHRPDVADGADRRQKGISSGWPGVDELLGALPLGVVHEWFGVVDARVPTSHAGARRRSSGRDSRAVWRPPLCILSHLAWRAVAPRLPEETDGDRRSQAPHGVTGRVMWIGPRVWPHPLTLARLGGQALLGASVFVDPPDDAARLWAIDLALRSGAVRSVVADGGGLDMAATRRLQLAAEAGGAFALLARPPWERDRLSAAALRWLVRHHPEPSEHPQWTIQLLRCKGVQPMGKHSRDASNPLILSDVHRWPVRWEPGRPGAAGAGVVPAALVDRAGQPASEQAGPAAERFATRRIA